MSSVFIKVPVSERLPSKDGDYWCKFKAYNALYIQRWVAELGGFGCNEDYEYWLEEIELPTDEELKNNIQKQGTTANYALYQSGYEDCANFILDKLKGGNNG